MNINDLKIEGIERMLMRAESTTDYQNFPQRLNFVFMDLHRELFRLENKSLYNEQDYWRVEGKYLTYIVNQYIDRYDK